MSANFDTAIKSVLAREGGYCNIAEDRGGPTNFGITQAVARANGYTGDMCDLPLAVAIDIYKRRYWLPLYDSFPLPLAIKVFDTAVNAGPSRAHKLLQQALNARGARLLVDGDVGPATKAALALFDPADVLTAYRAAQRQFYLDLIARDPSQAKFKNGWLARAAS